LDRPDFVLFDLDPGQARFADAVLIAKQLAVLFKKAKVKAFVKTSGKTGLHILTPWDQNGGYDEARSWAWELAKQAVDALPDIATVERSKAKRGRRVYVDVMQNANGRHAVPPYMLRPINGAPVSTPLDWPSLTPSLDPSQFNLKTIFSRLAKQKRDPMAELIRW
jgi:bifunctional non-homologous end joining protein LigD